MMIMMVMMVIFLLGRPRDIIFDLERWKVVKLAGDMNGGESITVQFVDVSAGIQQ